MSPRLRHVHKVGVTPIDSIVTTVTAVGQQSTIKQLEMVRSTVKDQGERYKFSMTSKQTKYSNDHIKGNRVTKGGGAPWYPLWGKH